MKVLFWNIRGFGARGRRNQICDLLRSEHIDILCLQETKREDFSLSEFHRIGGSDFTWNWVAAVGSAGGILTGSRNELFDILEGLVTEFFLSLRLACRGSSVSFFFEINQTLLLHDNIHRNTRFIMGGKKPHVAPQR